MVPRASYFRALDQLRSEDSKLRSFGMTKVGATKIRRRHLFGLTEQPVMVDYMKVMERVNRPLLTPIFYGFSDRKKTCDLCLTIKF